MTASNGQHPTPPNRGLTNEELDDIYRQMDRIQHHALHHGCCCKRLEDRISDLWAILLNKNWDNIPKAEPADDSAG
jgi:hypothetical protein